MFQILNEAGFAGRGRRESDTVAEHFCLTDLANAAARQGADFARQVASAALRLCPAADSAGVTFRLPDGQFRHLSTQGSLALLEGTIQATDAACQRAIDANEPLLFLRDEESAAPDDPIEILHIPVSAGRSARATLWVAVQAPHSHLGEGEHRILKMLAGFLPAVLLNLENEQVRGTHSATIDSFRRIAEALHDVVWLADHQGRRFIYISPGFQGIWDLEPDAVRDSFDNWLATVHADDRPRVAQQFLAPPGPDGSQAEFRITRTDGGVRWIHSRAAATGVPGQVAGIWDDVTAHRSVDAEWRDVTQRLRRQLEISPMAVVEFSPEGLVTSWSSNAERMFGWTEEEMRGRSAVDFVHPDDLEQVLERGELLFRGKASTTVSENRNIRRDGSVIWCEWYNSAILDEQGRTKSLISFVLDVSERRVVEHALRESQQRLALAQRAGGIGTFESFLKEGRVVWTESLERLFGLEPGTFEGRIEDWRRRVVPEDLAAVSQQIQAAASAGREELEYEFRAILPSGELRLLYTRARLFYDAATREPIRLLGINMDITEQRRIQSERERLLLEARQEIRRRHLVERRLRQSNDDLQQFAWSASHDMQEPLRTVALYSELMRRRFGDQLDPDADRFLSFINVAAHKMEGLLGDLLAYSRVATETHLLMEPVDSRQVLEDVLTQLAAQIRAAGARIEISGEMPHFRIWPVHLHLLLQNLISNALKYRSDRPPVVILTAETNGELHTFTVRDNGIGIENQYHRQIFGIFRRLHTQESYPGTGMGLAICQKIVERYGGSIWVESIPGQGSAFRFTFPENFEEGDGETGAAPRNVD